MDIPRNEYGFVLEIRISPKTNLESSPSIGIQPMKGDDNCDNFIDLHGLTRLWIRIGVRVMTKNMLSILFLLLCAKMVV